MSVQAGVWNFDGLPVDPALIANFSKSLQQQGPDGESTHIDGSIVLLYRPFHTTAQSRREEQPYTSSRGFVFMWDGRLDNREELMADLGFNLKSGVTDVAIVGAAFDRWETGCFRHLVGDWSVSIWDPGRQELFLAIDYMAIRHIFYYLRAGRVWWSSDLAPLVLLSGDKFHLDEDFICGFFAHDPDAHLTPYREIREVPPGQTVRIRKGIAGIERYWQVSPKSQIRYKSDREYEEHFLHVFRQSVRRRLRSDSPILAELSGGLDSSSIVCMADDILAKESGLTPRLDTLSYFDKTEPHGDDWIYFQKIENHRGRIGHHIDASELGRTPASLETIEFSALPGHLSSERNLTAKRSAFVRAGGYKAVLSGIGGDEFLGGIPNPSTQLADLIVQVSLLELFRQLVAWSLANRQPLSQLLSNATLELLPPSIARYWFRTVKPEPWIDHDFANRTRLTARLFGVEDPFGFRLPTRRSTICAVVLMANKLAKAISPHQEEICYPYLDRDLVEFVLSIPASQLLRPGERRSLMRRSLAGLVPHEILSRRTKQFGARTPVLALERNLEGIEMAFASPFVSLLGWVDRPRFLENLQAARNGRDVAIVRLMRTISLEMWLRDLAARQLIASDGLVSRPLSRLSRAIA